MTVLRLVRALALLGIGGLALMTMLAAVVPTLAARGSPMLVEYVAYQPSYRDLDYLYVDLEQRLTARLLRPIAAPSPAFTTRLPDGSELFTRRTPGNVDLFVRAPDSNLSRQLTRFSDFPPRPAGDTRRANVMPLWSPDAAWVLFTSVDVVGRAEVYALRADGSDLRLLVERLVLTTRNPLRPRWMTLLDRPADGGGALAAAGAGLSVWLALRRRAAVSPATQPPGAAA